MLVEQLGVVSSFVSNGEKLFSNTRRVLFFFLIIYLTKHPSAFPVTVERVFSKGCLNDNAVASLSVMFTTIYQHSRLVLSYVLVIGVRWI